MCSLLVFISILSALHVVNGQIDLCKHVQYSQEIVKGINMCAATSINGVTTSTMLTCDESGQTPIFNELTYNNEFCTGTSTNTETTTIANVTLSFT